MLVAGFFDQGFFHALIMLALAFTWGFALFDLVKRDISGKKRAAWLIIILVVPFVGALAYVVSRPAPQLTADELQGLAQDGRADMRLTQIQHPGI